MRVAIAVVLLLAIPSVVAKAEPLDVLWTSADHAGRVSDPFAGDDEHLLIARADGRYELVRFDLYGAWEVLVSSDARLEDPIEAGGETYVVGLVDGQRKLLRVTGQGLVAALPEGSQKDPAVHDDTIVFVGRAGEAENVMLWEGDEPRHLSPNPSGQTSPAVDDLYVAWTDMRSATPLVAQTLVDTPAAHPNNIDIYAMHRPSGNVFPVAEENAQQEFPEFASDHRLVYRSIEPDGRKLFMRDLSGQSGPKRIDVAPGVSSVGQFAVEGSRVAYISGPEATSSIGVWDLDRADWVGITGNVSAVIGMDMAGPVALVERITPEGSVVEAIRLPSRLAVQFTSLDTGDGAVCFEGDVVDASGPVVAYGEPGRSPIAVDGSRLEGCLQAGQRLRVSDGVGMTAALTPVLAPEPAESPAGAIVLPLLAAFLLMRRGR